MQRGGRPKEKSGKEYYEHWLKRDVTYIITPEEADVFHKLTSDEERNTFIEQFWERRNKTPWSSINEFKIEHYRRIQYANEHFSSGYDGWKTDRGRIYILYGDPYHIEDHPGGRYDRPMHEGGGITSAFPFQIWRYRHITGIGSDVEIEFVDTSESGDYRIARDAEEKDALLTMPGGGLTLDERSGRTTKGQRIDNRFVGNPNYFKYMREQDTPFSRLYLKAKLERPPVIQNTKLREAVAAKITFGGKLPFKSSVNYLKIGDERALVLLNLEIKNQDIAFNQSDLGIRKGTVEIYGSVTSLTGRLVAEFEHNIYSDCPDDRFEEFQKKLSVYQKALSLPSGIYKLELAIKDRVSDELGLQSIRLGVPNLTDTGTLAFSSLILCRGLVPLNRFPEQAEMFVLGDMKVIPSVDHQFRVRELIGIYAQAYQFDVDQTLLKPVVGVRYEVLRGDRVVKTLDDPSGKTVAFASGQRLVLTNSLPTGDLEVGEYQIRIRVEDRLSSRKGEVRTKFTLAAAPTS
jgi:GWxTD domain-containing protein